MEKWRLSFDGWVYHPQLTELAALARVFPAVPIILNHIGAPLGIGPYAGKRAEVFQLWSSGIVELAKCPTGSRNWTASRKRVRNQALVNEIVTGKMEKRN